jgi:hypothetical protein
LNLRESYMVTDGRRVDGLVSSKDLIMWRGFS